MKELNKSAFWGDARGIQQTFSTQAGAKHTISFDYTGRYGYDTDVNRFKILVDGKHVGTFSDDARYNSRYSSSVWHKGQVSFT